MNPERQYIKQLHEAVSSVYIDNLKKAENLAKDVLLPKLKQFGEDNNVSFENAKVSMLDSVIMIKNFELTHLSPREIITADRNARLKETEKYLISQIEQIVKSFVKDSLVKELHINPDSDVEIENDAIYIEMAGKGLYEAIENQEEHPEFKDALGRVVEEGDLVVRYGASGSGTPTLNVPAKVIGFKKVSYSQDYRWKVLMKNLKGNSATAFSMNNYIILDSRGIQ